MFADPMHQLKIAGLEVEPLPLPIGFNTRFGLDFSLVPWNGGLEALLAYAEDRFDVIWARDFIAAYASLASAAAKNPEMPLAVLGR
jgi:hypothetical protein